ncbi:hypothetical protein ANCCEY_14742 [Ancylostoma ceylanicum]|uniref:J domain-containing protein n=1 Tax=Ancylostoma ceylanicum TaxID=53326 RepID=A0A0D6LET3_9BILA|nr:hypothetical protein ANCCEY_14742 [Ancylostoma ceylanicum]
MVTKNYDSPKHAIPERHSAAVLYTERCAATMLMTYRKLALKWHPDKHTEEKDKDVFFDDAFAFPSDSFIFKRK